MSPPSPSSPGPSLCTFSRSASPERDRFLLSSGRLQVFWTLLLNCVPIERNTITLRDLMAIVNTCSRPSDSILAWSVSLERIGKPSLGGEGARGRWFYCRDRDGQLAASLGERGEGGVIFIRALKGGLEFRAEVRSLLLQV